MATRFIYAGRNSECLRSLSTVYATALAGASFAGQADNNCTVGQNFSSPNYVLYETFIEFDTGVSGVNEISSPSLAINVSSGGAVFDVNLRVYDWGGTVDNTDWRTPSQLTALTLAAFRDLTGVSVGPPSGPTWTAVFTDVALAGSINLTGWSRYVLSSARQESSSTPSGGEFVSFDFHSGDPSRMFSAGRLSVVDGTTQSSSTPAPGTTTFTLVQSGLHDVDLWGAGARPTLASNQEGGAGGGSYVFYSENMTGNMTISVPAAQTTGGTAGGACNWNPGASIASASGGAVIGQASIHYGLYYFLGGIGIGAQGGGGSRGGSGGGGGGGATGAGTVGSQGSGSSGGGAGTGGAGGGGNGGSGGNSGVAGGTGTTPSGGAGGGGNGADAGNGGAGKMVIYWYVPPIPTIPRRQPVIRPTQAVSRSHSW